MIYSATIEYFEYMSDWKRGKGLSDGQTEFYKASGITVAYMNPCADGKPTFDKGAKVEIEETGSKNIIVGPYEQYVASTTKQPLKR